MLSFTVHLLLDHPVYTVSLHGNFFSTISNNNVYLDSRLSCSLEALIIAEVLHAVVLIVIYYYKVKM